MKSFTLKRIRVSELAQVIDQVQTKDLGTMKDIRLTNGIVKDLMKSVNELSEKSASLRVKQQDLLKEQGIRERFIEESKDMNDDEKDAFGKKLDIEFQVLAGEKFKDEVVEIELLSAGEVEVSMGDEEHEKLKELFEKHCLVMYKIKDALIEVADALGL